MGGPACEYRPNSKGAQTMSRRVRVLVILGASLWIAGLLVGLMDPRILAPESVGWLRGDATAAVISGGVCIVIAAILHFRRKSN